MLQKLRNLDEPAKKKIILLFASIITTFIFVFWIFNFTNSFSKTIASIKDRGAAFAGQTRVFVSEVYNDFEEKKNLILNKTKIPNTTSTSTIDSASTTDKIMIE